MAEAPKILLLDDEMDALELYQQLLSTLPSKPIVRICDSGTKAMALLESEKFTLLISDLNMPKMDGLQVLSIVRRKYASMKIMVMTAVVDEQFKARAYSLGVDLYWQKPTTEQEIRLFLEGVESVLQRNEQGGFRGIQSKSLIDLVQLECLSRNSTVLKITNGQLVGKIWIIDGDLMDAEIGDLAGEDAFKKILSWRSGNFENLPADTSKERRIFNTVDGLLLDAVQTIDESQARELDPTTQKDLPPDTTPRETAIQLSAKVKGVDFLLAVPKDPTKLAESYGVENMEKFAVWTRLAQEQLSHIGEKFIAGKLLEIEVRSHRSHFFQREAGDRILAIGMERGLSQDECRETIKTVLSKWVS